MLAEFRRDGDAVIAESCAVALDAADYFGRSEDFVALKAEHFNVER